MSEESRVTDTPVETENQEQKTFTQDDIDRIIAQRVSAMERKFQQREQAAREEGRTEAAKLAKMTEEQRAQVEREQLEAKVREHEATLQKREAELTRRELKSTAVDTLEAKGLPRGLAEILNYTDAESCNASIDAIEKVFRSSVQAEVDKRLGASGVTLPTSAGKPDYSKMSDAEYYAQLARTKG